MKTGGEEGRGREKRWRMCAGGGGDVVKGKREGMRKIKEEKRVGG